MKEFFNELGINCESAEVKIIVVNKNWKVPSLILKKYHGMRYEIDLFRKAPKKRTAQYFRLMTLDFKIPMKDERVGGFHEKLLELAEEYDAIVYAN
jgi:hypothetical protein